jgi:zinc transport system ATP-binding protein
MSDNIEPVVELKDLEVTYENGVHALEPVTLDIYDGDFVGVIGPNGSGKSTLLKVILNLVLPSHGSVKLFGQPISTASLRKVGYVPQKTTATDVNFPSTVFETVLMGRVPHAGLFHRLGHEDHDKVEEILESLSLHDLRNRKIGQLSGGQSQRVLVAKALAGEPKLLILDEPTSGIDAPARAEFYKTIETLNHEKRITIMLSSHDIGVVTKLATKVVCLGGSPQFCGLTSDLSGEVLAKMYPHPTELMNHVDHP